MVRNNRGVTLTELIIVVAIIGVMAMIGPQIFTQVTKFFILGKARLELQREARGMMYVITRQLREAQSNTIIIDQLPNQPYYSRLQFSKVQGNIISIYQSGSKLIFVDGINQKIMTNNLAYMVFTFPHSDDMTIISVSLTLQEQIYGGLFKALHMASERVRVMN